MGKRTSGARTVVFANDYPMDQARGGWLAGAYPGHHLWGAEYLAAAGHDVVYAPHRGGGLYGRLSRRTGFAYGHLGDQREVLRHRRAAPVAYCAYSAGITGLARLRAAGRWPHPIVVVVHPGRPRPAVLAGLRHYDTVITISSQLREDLISEHGLSPERVVSLPWGPDLAFPGYASMGEDVIVSSGKTERDVGTLLQALEGTGLPARVRTGPWMSPLPPGTEPLADCLYSDLVPVLARAAVICLPLRSHDAGFGLTELNDALALGKPVVVTRNRYLEVDVEAVGCGIVVEPGDVRGWRDALMRLMGDRDLRRRMGAAGRRYAELHFNADLYGAGLVQIIENL
jgi:hypothetical protein